MRLLSARELVHEQVRGKAPNRSVSRLASDASCAIARGQDRLHTAVGVPNSLRTVGMGDELGLGNAERVLLLLRRGASRGSLRRSFPLRDASRDGDEIILLARAVPLRDPSRRQLWRLERGAFGARGGGASHCDGGVLFCPRL